MISIPIYDVTNNEVLEKNIDIKFIHKIASDELITQVLVRTRNNARQGSAAAKTRGEINFSTRKPWKQKGTGRARAGMRNSPIWVKGGVAFPPIPRDFSVSTPKKVRKLAFKSVLYNKAQNGDIYLVRNFIDKTNKTKDVLTMLNNCIPEEKRTLKMLIVYTSSNGYLNISLNNLRNISGVDSRSLCTYDLIRYDKIIITEEAMADIEKRI